MSKAIMRVPVERVEKAILLVRGEKVMLDRDLAAPTKALKQAVRRNIDRFPDDFMFVLDKTEFDAWRSQFVTSKSDRTGLRYPPMAFTEESADYADYTDDGTRTTIVSKAPRSSCRYLRSILCQAGINADDFDPLQAPTPSRRRRAGASPSFLT